MNQVPCCSFRGVSSNLGLGNATPVNLIKNRYVVEDGHMWMLTISLLLTVKDNCL